MREAKSRSRGLLIVVVPIDGQLFTPPISSGLLPGTFREQLLAEGIDQGACDHDRRTPERKRILPDQLRPEMDPRSSAFICGLIK